MLCREHILNIDTNPHMSQSMEPEVEAMYSEWLSKYGEKTAKQLRSYVDVSMPHYEWLRAKKI